MARERMRKASPGFKQNTNMMQALLPFAMLKIAVNEDPTTHIL